MDFVSAYSPSSLASTATAHSPSSLASLASIARWTRQLRTSVGSNWRSWSKSRYGTKPSQNTPTNVSPTGQGTGSQTDGQSRQQWTSFISEWTALKSRFQNKPSQLWTSFISDWTALKSRFQNKPSLLRTSFISDWNGWESRFQNKPSPNLTTHKPKTQGDTTGSLDTSNAYIGAGWITDLLSNWVRGDVQRAANDTLSRSSNSGASDFDNARNTRQTTGQIQASPSRVPLKGIMKPARTATPSSTSRIQAATAVPMTENDTASVGINLTPSETVTEKTVRGFPDSPSPSETNRRKRSVVFTDFNHERSFMKDTSCSGDVGERSVRMNLSTT